MLFTFEKTLQIYKFQLDLKWNNTSFMNSFGNKYLWVKRFCQVIQETRSLMTLVLGFRFLSYWDLKYGRNKSRLEGS